MFPSANGNGGGTKFQSMTPKFTTGSTSSTTSVTLLSVKGSGILTTVFQSVSSAPSGRIKITIDGVVVISSFSTGTTNPYVICPMYGFSQSLLIEHWMTNGSGSADTRVTYLLD